MSGLVLLRPWLILLALALLALVIWRLATDRRVGSWNSAIEPHLMTAMAGLGRVSGQSWSEAFRNPLIWAFLLALPVLSSPAIDIRAASAFRNVDGVVLVVDVSPSVTQSEAMAKTVTMARSMVQSIGSRPAGLVVYAGDAYIASELTSDTGQIEFTLELLDGETIPDQGSRPALGLEKAIGLLKSNETLRSDIVWLTDGGGLSDSEMARISSLLETADMRVTIVDSSATPSAKLNALGKRVGAMVFKVDEVAPATEHLALIQGQTLERSDLRLLSYRELGPLFLIPAALMMLLWFRRTA